MPRAPKRCARCDTLVAPGTLYCLDHRPTHTWEKYPSPSRVALTRQQRRQFADAVLTPGATCVYCGAQATQADHIIPIAEGGTNTPDNGQPICTRCHQHKTQAEAARARARRR